MRWFFPSWNGDFRAEVNEKDPNKTDLTIIEPTSREQEVLKKLGVQFKKKGWFDTDQLYKGGKRETVLLEVPLKTVGPLLVKSFKSGKATLSAVIMKDGKVETTEGSDVKKEFAEKVEEGKAAATVKRPTPCCPQCHPGAIAPASEVLLTFLDEQQHEDWAKNRSIVVRGGLSDHEYLLAHRHSRTAQQIGRICFDLDDRAVVHFHDNTVPPEEEVLAAKLILEHAEPWLRNEATLWDSYNAELVYKNPFGDGNDGVADAALAMSVGMNALMALEHAKRVL